MRADLKGGLVAGSIIIGFFIIAYNVNNFMTNTGNQPENPDNGRKRVESNEDNSDIVSNADASSVRSNSFSSNEGEYDGGSKKKRQSKRKRNSRKQSKKRKTKCKR